MLTRKNVLVVSSRSFSNETGFLHRLADKCAKLFHRKESPREMQERKDLYTAMLASTYKSLRSSSSSNEILVPIPREDMSLLIEEATNKLEERLVHRMTLRELRSHLQQEYLGPDTKHVFQAFSNAEESLLLDDQNNNDYGFYPYAPSIQPPSSSSGKSQQQQQQQHHKLNKQNKDSNKMKKILLQDFDELSLNVFHGKPASAFHITKLGATKTLLDYKQWISPSSESAADSSKQPSSSSTTPPSTTKSHHNHYSTDLPQMDEFGYYSMDDNAEIKSVMRNNQIINLSYAPLIKQTLGYSILSFRSTIPGAGRGIYVDGYACAGSIVAFFPGDIWPREHLQNQRIGSHFMEDDHFQLSLRYDDILIDSRKSPAVVLDTERSNPWAIAHLANHPPKQQTSSSKSKSKSKPKSSVYNIPNCRPLPINYTSEMKLSEEEQKYVPNRYARKPPLLGYNEAFERQDVYMHGMILVTTRDVENEELFYDYRLSGGSGSGSGTGGHEMPDWYHVCDEESLRNRWAI